MHHKCAHFQRVGFAHPTSPSLSACLQEVIYIFVFTVIYIYLDSYISNSKT